MNTKYDKLFVDGRFFTSDDNNLYGTTLGVKDGKIAYIADCLPEDADCEIVSLKGRRVIPGIIDNHIHPRYLADALEQIACLPPNIHSIAELKEEIKKRAANTPKGTWILGWGFSEDILKEGRTPNRYDLDEVAPDHPVMLYRICFHIVALNSKALEIVGVDENTVVSGDSVIEKDEKGIPTGILKEKIRFEVENYIPKDEESQMNKLLNLGEFLLSQGITGVADSSCDLEPKDFFDMYVEARRKGFKQRVGIYYMWDDVKKLGVDIDGEKKNPENPVFVAGLKLIGDGSLSGHTAWSDKPYVGTDDYGLPTATEEDYRDAAEYARKHEIQIKCHAMGEKTIERVADAFYKEADWLRDGRPSVRIEHSAMPTEESLDKIAESGIAMTIQPIFYFAEIASYLANIGMERTRKTYPAKTILEKGILLGFSSDAPATAWPEPSNPFVGMQSAVTRIAVDGTDVNQDEKVDIETAIKLYTSQSQKILGIKNVGSLKVGNYADFVVLDRDILEADPMTIGQTTVEQVYMSGEKVFEKEEKRK